MIYLTNLFTQVCTVAALFLTYMAHQWSTVGYGLNPYIALPIATLLMVAPHIFNHYFQEEIPEGDDLSCISLKTRTQR
jgi:hypothetical protein